MIEIDLALILGMITIVGALAGLIGSIIKFSNAINSFEHSITDLKLSMHDSKNDRLNLRNKLNEHSIIIERINTQYENIQEDLQEIKRKVS